MSDRITCTQQFSLNPLKNVVIRIPYREYEISIALCSGPEVAIFDSKNNLIKTYYGDESINVFDAKDYIDNLWR